MSRPSLLLAGFLTPRWHAALKVLALTLAIAAVAVTTGSLLRGDPRAVGVARQLLIPSAMLVLLMLVAVRHERRWRADTQRLRAAIREARWGNVPPSAVSDAVPDHNPELAGLAAEAFRLAKDLREQQRLVRRLEIECKAEVAFRTDELERQVNVLRAKAQRDALTALNNRGSFDELFPAMVRRARDAGRDLSLVMADLDHFKVLNDTLGHPAGDAFLRDVGRLIRGAVRDSDAAFRYGGDEFVMVLDGADDRQARATAERLARLVDALGRPPPGAQAAGDELRRRQRRPTPPRRRRRPAAGGRRGRLPHQVPAQDPPRRGVRPPGYFSGSWPQFLRLWVQVISSSSSFGLSGRCLLWRWT